ncbi:hypothetical protein ADUPG1_014034, partial [Aduncisulcus paluster]
ARHGSKEEETSGDPFDPKDKEEEEEDNFNTPRSKSRSPEIFDVVDDE